MKLLFALSALVLCAQAISDAEIKEHWADFKVTYNKVYPTELEERKRFGIFKESLRRIEERALPHELHNGGLMSSINRFADMTQEEIKNFMEKSMPNSDHSRKEQAENFKPVLVRPHTLEERFAP